MHLLRKNKSDTALLTLIILENLLLFITNTSGILSSDINALCLIVCSLLIGITLIIKFYGHSIVIQHLHQKRSNSIVGVLFIAGTIWTAVKTSDIIEKIAINPVMSDIIPAIKAMVQAFVLGRNPYGRDTILHLGYAAPSPYMPMHWIPYTIAEMLACDYRWITYSIWVLTSYIVVRRCGLYSFTTKTFLTIGFLFCIYFLVTDRQEGTIGMTVEPMVAGYYMLLICSMNFRKPILQGVAIAVCMMSRYSLALWLPLWAFVLFASGHKVQLLKASIAVFALLLVFYVLPYMSRDIFVFFDSHMVYEKGAIYEWTHNAGGTLPYHLFKGAGIAQFFYSGNNVQFGYTALRLCMFIAIGISILCMAVWYWINKGEIDYRIFLMGSFKIYLSVFLAFIMVPYLYLMIVGNFVSVAIYAEQSKYRTHT